MKWHKDSFTVSSWDFYCSYYIEMIELSPNCLDQSKGYIFAEDSTVCHTHKELGTLYKSCINDDLETLSD